MSVTPPCNFAEPDVFFIARIEAELQLLKTGENKPNSE